MLYTLNQTPIWLFCIVGTEMIATTSGNADTGNVFRYQNGSYMYNLSTKGLSTGTWQFRVDLGDVPSGFVSKVRLVCRLASLVPFRAEDTPATQALVSQMHSANPGEEVDKAK